MSGKLEYLEKYSVAPSPSRDYYGIKVLRDEVILFLWKISHGPHRAPTIRVTKFSEFDDDKSLQDEIQRVFGSYLLEHVKNIASEKELSLLTLPKNVISRISKYLKFKDIINLSTLSYASKEVFDNDVVWKTLYRKYKRSKISKEEKQYAMASSWKQLVKEKQLQESIKSQKAGKNEPKAFQPTIKERSRQSGINLTSVKNPNSLPFSKKSLEDSKKLPNTESLLRPNTLSKVASEKRKINLKSTISMTRIPDESTNKLLPSKQFKINSTEKESSTNRSQLTVNKNISQKINSLTKPKSSINLKSTENLKPKKSSISKTLETKLKSNRTDSVRSQKLVLDSKLQSNEDGKPKKINKNKSTTLSFDKTWHADDINSFIEESFKNVKSPRSIFDYDFSILEDRKSAGDSKIFSPRPETQNLKRESSQVEVISNPSARSESQSDDDDTLNMEHFTQKYLNARAEFMKKMSEASSLTSSKAQAFSNHSSNTEFQKPLSTIPENLRKTRASVFATKGIESKNIIQEMSKIRLTKGNNVLKK